MPEDRSEMEEQMMPAGPTNGGARPTSDRRGPKTVGGKARVRVNAVTHGLTAAMPVIPGVERPEDWEAQMRGVVASLQPVGRLEQLLAERVALQLWRLNRVVAYEQARLGREPGGWLLPEGDLQAVVRYEAHLGRQLYQALNAIHVLQARRCGDPVALAQVEVHGLPDA